MSCLVIMSCFVMFCYVLYIILFLFVFVSVEEMAFLNGYSNSVHNSDFSLN